MAASNAGTRILLVDDEPEVRDVLAGYLRTEGFGVSEAGDGLAALDRAREDRPDLVILDLMLPLLSGTEVFGKLRATSNVAIIMLSARVEEVDRIIGLELGADDYVVKPFSPREVVARVKAVLRRTRGLTERHAAPSPARAQRIANLEIDREGYEVRLDGKPVSLTPTEFRILDVLGSDPGRVFSRARLLDKILGEETGAFDRTLDRHIANLRQKIEPDPAKPRFILTVFGVGYKMAAT
jgi:DNA-binding response OmpR family regulator